jgi:tetratricopeptide (TPR) repeat protein
LKIQNFSFLILILLLAACSSQKNTWTSKAYHNTTAHFNGYWYAKQELQKIEETIRKSQVDDYNRVLLLFPTIDTTLANSYDKEIQEAIKMASIAIQRHPNSKWVDDAYILVGQARHYSLDWGNAIQTFKYTNKISKDKDTKHLAIIELISTYIDHKEFNNAKAAMDFLQKEKLNKSNAKKLALQKAYYYQLHQDYDNMVRNLTQASPDLKKADHRGRIYFIIGQVYQKLGFEGEAYRFYKKCISTNPEYEVDFYARLYMAQVTEISRSKDILAARKSFNKLLTDLKNKEFKDKIYYEMGVFELRHKQINPAITNFEKSVREGKNERIDGEAYLRLGEIYYDTLKNYELAQAYYDSAITSLPPDYENYQEIKTRQQVLNEFVTHLKTIQWQDSLLSLADTDSSTIIARVKVIVEEKQKAEQARAAQQKKRANRINIDGNDNNSVFNSDNGDGDDNATGNDISNQSKDWYFGNSSAMSIGQSDFVRVWGNITLADNWRRSLKQRSATSRPVADDTQANTTEKSNNVQAPAVDPVKAEYAKLNEQIPRTPERKKEALGKIEDAYFKLGGIYYFKLHESDNAVQTFSALLSRFPSTEFEAEVLYTLYIIFKEKDPTLAEQYAEKLKSKFPSSTFAKILVNPNYLQESGLAAERQKVTYKIAYSYFDEGKYRAADSVLRLAFAEGETSFTPSLELLKVLIIGETEDVSKYQYELDEFIKKYPETQPAEYAKKLLASSRNFQEVQEKRKGIQYIKSLNEPHYFVILYKRADNVDEMISSALAYFNAGHFDELKLNITNLNFNDELALAFVSDLPNVTTALEYYRTFSQNVRSMNEFRNFKFDNFVITKDNFDTFYRTKGLDEYLQFFEKNYPSKDE